MSATEDQQPAALPGDALPAATPPGGPPPGPAVDLPSEPAAQLRLDDQLCFALYTAASAVVRNYRPLLHDLGLTYPQYVLLMTLWENDNTSVGDVATRLRVPLTTITPLLDRLEADGLLERRRSTQDRRHINITLTDTGRALERRAAQAQHQVRCQTRLSPTALAALRSELHTLTHALDDHL